MNSEKFYLKWNDFQQTVSNSFGILRKEEDFFDVTLVSDDEVHLSSHKLVLSASSDFFKSILKKTSNPHPIIYLSGINSRDLNFIIDYIYHGEVQIYQEQLDGFLDVAQRLRIAGLNSNQNEEEELSKGTSTDEGALKEEKAFTHPSSNNFVESSNESTFRPFTTSLQKLSFSGMEMDTTELDEKIKSMIAVVDGIFTCKVCGKTAKLKTNLNNHIETHIEGLSFPCQQCGKTCRSRVSLKMHHFKYHKN